jgi:hypothetical protein
MSHSTHLSRTRRAGRLKLNKPETANKAPAAQGAVADEEHHAMIAEAAYYLAERRGFESGHELKDWLLAESEINASIRGGDVPKS